MEYPKPSGRTILVVEDEPSLQKVITKKLQNEGFRIVTAESVPIAFERLKEEEIALVWLDHYLLGQENGLDLVTELKKEDSKWKHIPILVVSNTATQDKIKSYIRLGVDRYYTKANSSLEQILTDMKEILKIPT